jgi:hypothetical protein
MATTGNRGIDQTDEREPDRLAIANLDNLVQFFRILLEWDKNRRGPSVASSAHKVHPDTDVAGALITPSWPKIG